MLTRREALRGIGVAVGAAALGCGHETSGQATPPDGAAASPPDGAPPVPDASPDATAVTACTSTSTMSPAELLANIDTIVVLCMENRSFDHYLGSLRLVEKRAGVDGLTGAESNPAPDGSTVAVHQLETFTPADPPHDWSSCHTQWDDGANDGFVKAHAGADQADVMGYYVRAQLPITYALADQACVCQRWFASVMGPTWPNRFYLHCGTANGMQTNLPVVGLKSVFDQLAAAKVAATNYYHDVAWAAGGYLKLTGTAPVEQFFSAAQAGTLPPFSIVDPQFTGTGANDDHPSHDVRLGQALIASVVAAMAQSPQWPRSLLVITYDEHGGFFDHVPPPTASDATQSFQQLGFRVPAMAIGPTVRAGCVVDDVLEHASVVATVAVKWGLTPLTERAAAASDLSVLLDPLAFTTPHPPPVLPPLMMSRRALAERRARPEPPAHEELRAALDAHPLPPGLDRRADADAITDRVLAWGEKLAGLSP
jgi:phospholipase C